MKPVIVQGTLLKCGFGNAPTPIMVMPDKKVNAMLPVAVKTPPCRRVGSADAHALYPLYHTGLDRSLQ